MIIRKEQSAYLGKIAFIRRLREVLCKQFEQARATPRHELNAEIFRQMERAVQYGLQSEHAAAAYVMTAWLLGPQFDEKLPAAGERLRDPNASEAQKVLWLQTFSVNLLNTLQKTGSGV